MLFIQGLVIREDQAKIVDWMESSRSGPSFTVNADLRVRSSSNSNAQLTLNWLRQKNIVKFAHAVFLSPKLAAYRGERLPLQYTMVIGTF